MDWVLIGVVVGVAIILSVWQSIKSEGEEEIKKELGVLSEKPYMRRDVLTRAEYTFFAMLNKAVADKGFYVCPKVRLEDFLYVRDKKNLSKWRGHIRSRHVDFLICDAKMQVVAGIELDDKSHEAEKQKVVDKFKDDVFTTVQIPLFRVKVGSNYEARIGEIIGKLMA